jgi:hypothetical protein
MARINVTADILKHNDEEIIEYLAEEAKAIRANFNIAQKVNRPELLYVTRVDLEIITNVLIELDKRNKLRA